MVPDSSRVILRLRQGHVGRRLQDSSCRFRPQTRWPVAACVTVSLCFAESNEVSRSVCTEAYRKAALDGCMLADAAFVRAMGFAPGSHRRWPKGGEMRVRDSVRAELEEQRCLIEQQQVTIQRQQRKIELWFRLAAHMQAEL